MHTVRGARFAVGAALLVVAGACDSSTGLPAATNTNVVDTISIYALDGTPLTAPSGYYLPGNAVVRTDRALRFDFAFNITPAGEAVLLPTGALGLGQSSGIQLQSVPFDAITIAPTTVYEDSAAVVFDSGTVAVLHSQAASCGFSAALVFYYGKVEVLAIDTVARRMDLQVLVDQNCGYRGLEPGIPRR